MAIQMSSAGGKAAIGYDSVTYERGFLVKMINRTGGASVKGNVIACSATTDKEAILQSNELDSVGVIQEAGVAEGSEMWVWVNGSVAQVLYKDTIASTRGYVCLAADTDGRAIDVAVPTVNPVVAEHFKEIGHVMESKVGGANVLVLVHLHFN